MEELRSAVCSCGNTMFDNIDRCSTCAQSRQKRMSQHSYALPERPAKQLTPPPSQHSSPRRSYETLAPMPTTDASAGEVLTRALSSEGGSSSLFPISMHRQSSRFNGEHRRASDFSSTRSAGLNTPAVQAGEDASRKQSRSATPDFLESGYSPIAAGFARLGRKNNDFGGSLYDQAMRGRASSARPSPDLGARMFSGPA